MLLIWFQFLQTFGVPFFVELPDLGITVETNLDVLMTQEALAFLYPYIGKQVVNIDNDDLFKLGCKEKVKIDDFSEKAKADLKETGEYRYWNCCDN